MTNFVPSGDVRQIQNLCTSQIILVSVFKPNECVVLLLCFHSDCFVLFKKDYVWRKHLSRSTEELITNILLLWVVHLVISLQRLTVS
jgi:hypothetical protein